MKGTGQPKLQTKLRETENKEVDKVFQVVYRTEVKTRNKTLRDRDFVFIGRKDTGRRFSITLRHETCVVFFDTIY